MTYPFTHDLERLMELVEGSEQPLPPDRDSIVDLTPWAVEFRYGEAPGDELDRLATLMLLEELLGWAHNLLDPSAT